jgi:vacuolar protein sorting-associated protein 41
MSATIGLQESSQMTRMAEEETSKEPEAGDKVSTTNGQPSPKTPQATATDDTEDEEEEEEEEEPRLKYAPLTKHLASLYRNGDASSAFLVAGDKMVGSLQNNVWRIAKHAYACHFADCWDP